MTDINKRIFLIEKIIQLDSEMEKSMQELRKYKWDFDGQAAILNKEWLKEILTRFINGDLRANEIHEWADFLEVRDDVDYPENDREKISEIMQTLANPISEGELTAEKAKQYISQLS